MQAWLNDEVPFPKSRVSFYYQLHGPYNIGYKTENENKQNK
jgi:hypothetical protein